jgi:hypothetical protein
MNEKSPAINAAILHPNWESSLRAGDQDQARQCTLFYALEGWRAKDFPTPEDFCFEFLLSPDASFCTDRDDLGAWKPEELKAALVEWQSRNRNG